jgi:hypothetical protein
LTDLSIFQQHIWMTHVFVCKVGPYTLQSASTEQKKRRKLSWVATIYVCAGKKLSITRTEDHSTILSLSHGSSSRYCRACSSRKLQLFGH